MRDADARRELAAAAASATITVMSDVVVQRPRWEVRGAELDASWMKLPAGVERAPETLAAVDVCQTNEVDSERARLGGAYVGSANRTTTGAELAPELARCVTT